MIRMSDHHANMQVVSERCWLKTLVDFGFRQHLSMIILGDQRHTGASQQAVKMNSAGLNTHPGAALLPALKKSQVCVVNRDKPPGGINLLPLRFVRGVNINNCRCIRQRGKANRDQKYLRSLICLRQGETECAAPSNDALNAGLASQFFYDPP